MVNRKAYMWFVLGFIILHVSCAFKNKTPPLNYFDCESYSYFPNNEDGIILTHNDTVNLIKSALRFNCINQALIFGKDTSVRGLFHLLPFVRNRIDTGWYSYMQSIENSKFSFQNLSFDDVYPIIISDGLIQGRVIEKRQPNKSNECLFYKTEYIIEVIDVIHSYFSINPGDKVLIKDIMGFNGGCNNSKDSTIFVNYPHLNEYKKDEICYFLLDRSEYEFRFIRSKDILPNKLKMDDIYCPQFFCMLMWNYNYSEQIKWKANELKTFFNTKFKNHEYE